MKCASPLLEKQVGGESERGQENSAHFALTSAEMQMELLWVCGPGDRFSNRIQTSI